MYVIAPRDQVKGENEFPEFRDILPDLQTAAEAVADDTWSGFNFGGIRPDDRQYGMTSLRPQDTGVGTLSFVQSYSDPGSWTDIFNYSVPEDQIHALAGVALPDSDVIFSHLRFEISDRKLPSINVEEALTFPGGVDILFKQDQDEEFVLREEESVLIRGMQERGTSGQEQRIIPLGFTLYRRKDDFITENAPSA